MRLRLSLVLFACALSALFPAAASAQPAAGKSVDRAQAKNTRESRSRISEAP